MLECTIVTSGHHGNIIKTFISNKDKTIILARKLATGSIHDYLFYYCLLVDILFEVVRIVENTTEKDNDTDQKYLLFTDI